jgi:hypothetical protein
MTFDELLKQHLDAMWHDSDEGSEIGENVSSVEEVKIIFDGYGDLETDDEYIEGGDKNMESFAIFIHKGAAEEGFVFPEHDMTPWALIHRPKEEVCIWAWHDVANDSWDILPLEDRLEDVDMTEEEVMNILEVLHERHFNYSEPDFEVNVNRNAWPFPSGDKV